MDSSTFGNILDQLSLSTLRYHWQTVLTSTVIFAIVYEISRIFSPVLFPKTFQFFKGVSWIIIMLLDDHHHHVLIIFFYLVV
jgi:hypothetical protein